MQVNILIADSSIISLEGLNKILSEVEDFTVLGYAVNSTELFDSLESKQPDILLMDYSSYNFDMGDIAEVRSRFPQTRILAITPYQEREKVKKGISLGIQSHLSKDCDKEEIRDAIYATVQGEQFFCGKIVDSAIANSIGLDRPEVSCDPVQLSSREIEIVRLIAEGRTNKEIADQLFLSGHTVNTHRKNIMNKLGINNTAGLVMYAVKEDLISPNKFLFASAN